LSSSRRTPPPSDRQARPTSGAGASASRGSTPRRRAAPPRKPFLERNRTRLLVLGAAVALIVVGGFAVSAATSPAYACDVLWTPGPTASPAPSATERLGYVQPDMGRDHINPGTTVRYPFCPPASGKHINQTTEGPIRPGVYGPNDKATPEGWIHNLEHGALVLLYKCPGADACTDAGQNTLKQLYATFPNGPRCDTPKGIIGPIFARFDDMAWPYAALLWGQVMPMESLDTQRVVDFFLQQGERYNPEQQCQAPSPSPAPTATPGPSASPAPSAAGSAAPSTGPSTGPNPS
jgi:hypothetical protein